MQNTENLDSMKWAFVARKAAEKHLLHLLSHGNSSDRFSFLESLVMFFVWLIWAMKHAALKIKITFCIRRRPQRLIKKENGKTNLL